MLRSQLRTIISWKQSSGTAISTWLDLSGSRQVYTFAYRELWRQHSFAESGTGKKSESVRKLFWSNILRVKLSFHSLILLITPLVSFRKIPQCLHKVLFIVGSRPVGGWDHHHRKRRPNSRSDNYQRTSQQHCNKIRCFHARSTQLKNRQWKGASSVKICYYPGNRNS